jgi:FtsH-binding integral membrane protein
MNDTRILLSAFAISILVVFLIRFYRRSIAPGLKHGTRAQTLGGVAVIIASIVLSIVWRKYF